MLVPLHEQQVKDSDSESLAFFKNHSDIDPVASSFSYNLLLFMATMGLHAASLFSSLKFS